MNQIKGFLEDYLIKTNKAGTLFNNIKATTFTIFRIQEGFIEELKANFSVIDKKTKVERVIKALRQKGSATAYTKEFQRYSTKIGQDDGAL